MINSMRRGLVGVLVLSSFAWSASRSYVAFAQTPDEAQSTSWSKGAISHAQRMLSFPNPATTVQRAPFVIPSSEVDLDANGVVADVSTGGTDSHREQSLLPKPGDERKNLFHLPSASNRMDDQRPIGSRSFCSKRRYRPIVPAGRRCDLSQRRCLYSGGAESSL